MAKFEMKIDESFMNALLKLSEPETIDRVLTAGGEVLAARIKEAVRRQVKDGTGALENSIKPSKPKESKEGYRYLIVEAVGKDAKGVRNMSKLAYMEYGVESRNRPARPFMKKATNDARADAERAMQEEMDK